MSPRKNANQRRHVVWCLLALVASAGCGTTRSSDTSRTATEQLLISDAIDRAVEGVDFRILAGQKVYLDDRQLSASVDRNYLISSLRQHLLASGCVLQDLRDNADFVLEARSGAVGTDSHDLLFGVPAVNVPQIVPLQGIPAAIPEIPIVKRRDQRAVAKLAVFAYHRETGKPVWQSGLTVNDSTASGIWVLGAGPFQKGTIFDGTHFAGQEIDIPLVHRSGEAEEILSAEIDQEALFNSPYALTGERDPSVASATGPPSSGRSLHASDPTAEQDAARAASGPPSAFRSKRR